MAPLLTGSVPSVKKPGSPSSLSKFTGKSLSCGKRRLLDLTVTLFNLREDVDLIEKDCVLLIDRVVQVTSGILDKISEDDSYDAQEQAALDSLNKVVQTILDYTTDLLTNRLLRRLTNLDAEKSKVQRYNQQLNDSLAHFVGHISINTRALAIEVKTITEALQESIRMSNASNTSLSPPPAFEETDPADALLVKLPPEPRIFHGRDAVFQLIVESILGVSAPHIPILGTGGIGKTTLATKILYEKRIRSKYGKRRFFIKCDGLKSADEIWRALATELGVTAPPGPGLQEAVLENLRSLRPYVLLVLDNLETAWDTDDQENVEDLLNWLCNLERLGLMITMRGSKSPDKCDWLSIPKIQPLEPEHALALFVQVSGRAADKELDDLLFVLDGLPLAITLMASLAKSGQTASELLESYNEEKTPMVKKGKGNERTTSLDASIRVSLKCQTMQGNPLALELLKLLALLPDGVHNDELSSLFPSMKLCKAAIRTLQDVALAIHDDKITRVLVPIRTYMQEYHPCSGQHLQEMRVYYISLASQGYKGFNLPPDAKSKLVFQLANTQSVLRHALTEMYERDKVLGAVSAVGHFSYMTWSGDCRSLLHFAISLYEANVIELSDVACALAECQRVLGDSYRVQQALHQANELLSKAKETFLRYLDMRGAAHCAGSLGYIYQAWREFNRAGELFEEAKNAFYGIGDRLSAAQYARDVGDILVIQAVQTLGNPTIHETEATFLDMGDRLGAGQYTWGGPHDSPEILELYAKSRAAFTEAETIYVSMKNPSGRARCVQSLADLLLIEGKYDDAKELHRECSRLFKDLDERRGAVRCIRSTALIHVRQGQYEAASKALQEAKAAYEKLGDRLWGAACIADLGEVCRMTKEYDRAKDFFLTARATLIELQRLPELKQTTDKLNLIARARRQAGDAAGASVDASS